MLHKRNLHQSGYDFDALKKAYPDLEQHIILSKAGKETVDFSKSNSVLSLNQALLKHHYKIEFWDLPKNYLCPPIPGRADYIHYVADLLAKSFEGDVPVGKHVKALDIGVGANCIYPILGHKLYEWSFVGVDVDPIAVRSSKAIAEINGLKTKIEIRKQLREDRFFDNVIKENEEFALTICNPPFFKSEKEAEKVNVQKWSKLKKQKVHQANRNFSGQRTELSYPGGEQTFIARMIQESRKFKTQCLWFTTLVSKKEHLDYLLKGLEKAKVVEHEIIEMRHGQKYSRILAWTYLNEKQRINWWK
ncbi:MAG: 23S rRNA (adenine(1618)-N(6))-methyltransferase RlmF [Bacteroidota bacterium]